MTDSITASISEIISGVEANYGNNKRIVQEHNAPYDQVTNAGYMPETIK